MNSKLVHSVRKYDLGAQWTIACMTWGSRMGEAMDNGGLSMVAIGNGVFPFGSLKAMLGSRLAVRSLPSRWHSS